MFRLHCAVQTYAWGNVGDASTVSQLAELNGDVQTNPDTPYAEYWFGTHHAGPASVRLEDAANAGSSPLLSAWLRSRPAPALGALTERADCVMTEDACPLPYLAKVLSVAKCLSIQAHPDKALAERLHAERPSVYKDPNHKPEMSLALTPFEAMCGFRRAEEILSFADTVPEFRAVLGNGRDPDAGPGGGPSDGLAALEELRAAAELPGAGSDEVAPALRKLFRAYANAEPGLVAAEVDKLVARVGHDRPGEARAAAALPDDPSGRGLAEGLAVRLAGQYPGDVGVFAPFLLNFLRLAPGEAIFLAANEPHAYVSGDCFEVMANSNNVVRMGCTPKLRDVPVLTEMLTFTSGLPNVLTGTPSAADPERVRLYTPTDPAVTEFQIERATVPTGEATCLPAAATPSVVIVVDGEGTLACDKEGGGEPVIASRGQVYVQEAGKTLTVEGGGDGGALVFRVHCRE